MHRIDLYKAETDHESFWTGLPNKILSTKLKYRIEQSTIIYMCEDINCDKWKTIYDNNSAKKLKFVSLKGIDTYEGRKISYQFDVSRIRVPQTRNAETLTYEL